jgi:hypothetical protein
MSRTLLGGLVRAPRLRLRLPALEAVLPSETALHVFFFATYFLVTAGVIYDILTEVPAMGAEYDQQTGQWYRPTHDPWFELMAQRFTSCDWRARRDCRAV